MSRTYRKAFTKPRHANAIPYKRNNPILRMDIGEYEVTIERDNRRKAQY
jgi:hypothetical protein